MRVEQIISMLEAWGLELRDKMTKHQETKGQSQQFLEIAKLGYFIPSTATGGMLVSNQCDDVTRMVEQLSIEARITIANHYFFRERESQSKLLPIHMELSRM